MMTLRVDVKPELLTWALERSQRPREDFAKFEKLELWLTGELAPTLRQLQGFATATRTPVGMLLLAEPPHDELPIPDFRTLTGDRPDEPSPDLMDAIAICEERQEWFRSHLLAIGEDPLEFVGSVSASTDAGSVAETMREAIDFEFADRTEIKSWRESFATLRDLAEDVGVLVMVSGVVGSNTSRVLDPREFRGFALVDDFAPVVFVNGRDTVAAQIFTLAHELAHIWLGQSAVSSASMWQQETTAVERWCDQVAAQFLVPREELARVSRHVDASSARPEAERLARIFKVSTLVILRSLRDSGRLSDDDFATVFAAEREYLISRVKLARAKSPGGNFYNTQPARVGKTFARALIADTLEGRTLHRDALRMLGFKKFETFDKLSRELGVA